ncbi:hypothetical protein HRI_001206800 [Hibiscus trionum]|uniref:Uncharacterized protein n=1 Tax=Hibiscus trionum TaxID=183268 RepID=A0A9W7HD26_HIBTR|nr:hypothetical protein HRI_001206800 [Hibiscus trionum]
MTLLKPGNLFGIRQGQPVFITKLEGYRLASASETLTAHWPQNMRIVHLISQDHMKNKFAGKADFLVFRTMNHHGFLEQLRLKKLCAVIQLPSQTLLFSVTNQACRLIGKLFPGEVVFCFTKTAATATDATAPVFTTAAATATPAFATTTAAALPDATTTAVAPAAAATAAATTNG